MTEYFSHSPGRVHPTLKPPPASVVLSMSTSVVRYCPPPLPVVVSTYATPGPPSSKFSAWIVPGRATAVPPNGVRPEDVVTEATFEYAESPAAL